MRVLIVEDQKNAARRLARGLREHSYAVDVVASGDERLASTMMARYELIILDLMPLGADSVEICRALRRRGIQTPILMLAAFEDKKRRIEGLDAGADDYLVKPFDFDELLARVRALLRRSTRDYHAATLRVDDLELDATSHGARRSGREIPLTRKEYSLLEYFLLNPGRLIGRPEIAANVWDEPYDPDSNTIEVYVARLRRKVDEGSSVKLLHTQRGVGYLLEPRVETAKT